VESIRGVSAAARAISFVTARSTGAPAEPDLRVTLNFHPDRPVGDLQVLEAMARDGVYRSQFETRTSNGGLTAHPGGDRWRWESRLFGGAYDDSPPADRPKYGSLNVRRRAVGGSPRFGSAHLRLTGDVLERSTFCYPDSTFEPTDVGVISRMDLIALAEADDRDLLDDYIEAQVHGPILLSRDVEAVVLDPCYRRTAVEAAAHSLGCAVEWHPGYRLSVTELLFHADYRGPEYVELGVAVARDDYLDPAMIGAAARRGRYDEQDLKRVWHLLARFGGPMDEQG
jgi:hypothetical protein